MIEFPRNRQQTIPESSVKIVGLGGAGTNMLDRVALDGIEGAALLALNTDIRTLNSTVAGEKIQLGRNLTKGLGTGGDPELGQNAILEAEAEIRKSLENHQIVFLCVGLGGGTGSGAAPILVRLAREAGAFVVVFATMPFAFEGSRRRNQAEESLNQLAVLSNALVTFDNGRMGELVLPKQGVHEAFSAADRMISDSITAVARLVLRPGLINVGLDELMSALKTTRSRCLFGSGIGRGENRAQEALKNALNSPLLDRGSLLADATTVLVHICGGGDMTLFEVELLMQGLTKHIPDKAHLLFGAATDPQMKEALSVTIISALPEERLRSTPIFADEEETEVIEIEGLEQELEQEAATATTDPTPITRPEPTEKFEKFEKSEPAQKFDDFEDEDDEDEDEFGTPDPNFDINDPLDDDDLDDEEDQEEDEEEEKEKIFPDPEPVDETPTGPEITDEFVPSFEPETPTIPGPRTKPLGTNQGELLLDGAPKGRFDGDKPNKNKQGEDLDIPPYLRRRNRR